jgi:transposase
MRHIGIDLHTNSFTVCIMENGQKTFETYNLQNEIEAFIEQVNLDDEIALEATGNSSFFYEKLKDFVAKVTIIAPYKFNVIKKSVSKTDKNDAANLALFLSKDLLPKSRIKDKKYEQLASICETRDKLTKLKTVLINKIHGILNRHGIKAKKETLTTKRGLARIEKEQFDLIVRAELEVIIAQIFSLKESIKKLEVEMINFAKDMQGFNNLTSIKGIGERSASILLAAIGRIEDFENEDKLASYFGIVPRVYQSNEKNIRGKITKAGNKLGRTTLVQCTLVAIRYSEYLHDFYQRLKNKKGSGKAIIATARKLLKIIFNTLKNNWIFEDFTTFKLTEQKL